MIKLEDKVDAEIEVVGVIAVAAAIEVLSVKPVEETEEEAVAPHRPSEYFHREFISGENQR